MSVVDDDRITTFERLAEVYGALERRLGDEMGAAVGLPLVWYNVLRHIAQCPAGLRPMNELVQATAFTTGGVTRLVDRMEQAGYVERRPCPHDRRVHYVGLTEAGRAVVERATSIHRQGIQHHLLAALEPADLIQLEAILVKLQRSLSQG